jgi:hypothetical protein
MKQTKEYNEMITRNFNKAYETKNNFGLNEAFGVWEDYLITYEGDVKVDRHYMTDDGGFLDVEDVTELYEDDNVATATEGGH